MKTNNIFQASITFDDIIFTGRNHAYGAYYLRKRYSRYLIIAFLTSFTFVASAVVGPFLLSSRDKALTPPPNQTTGEFTTPPEDIKPPVVEIPRISQPSFVPVVVDDSIMNPDDFLTMEDMIEVGNVPPQTADLVVVIPNDGVIVEETKPFLNPEESATFEGGDLNAFHKWVSQNMQYPPEAAEIGLEGKVIAQFVVGKNGKVEEIKIIRGVDPMLDSEAIRVLKTSPVWKPGRQGGRDVRQQFVLPVTFKLTK